MKVKITKKQKERLNCSNMKLNDFAIIGDFDGCVGQYTGLLIHKTVDGIYFLDGTLAGASFCNDGYDITLVEITEIHCKEK